MHVILEVVGDEEHEFEVESATYADLLEEVGLSPNEVAVIVDGRPVPEDQRVEAGRARVLRLVSGGSSREQSSRVGGDSAPQAPVDQCSDGTHHQVGAQLTDERDLRVTVGRKQFHLGLIARRSDQRGQPDPAQGHLWRGRAHRHPGVARRGY